MDFFENNTSINHNNSNFEQILQITNDTAFSSSSSSSLFHFQEYSNENFERLTNTAINNFFNFQNDIQLNSYIPNFYQNRDNENYIVNNNIETVGLNNNTCNNDTSMLMNSGRTGKIFFILI